MVAGALWSPRSICAQLVQQGLAKESSILLERVNPVAKSSTSSPERRPKPLDHVRTLGISKQIELVGANKITIIDDVITKGATLIAAASVLKHHLPDASISVFGLVRTISYGEISAIMEPVLGEITVTGNDANRNP